MNKLVRCCCILLLLFVWGIGLAGCGRSTPGVGAPNATAQWQTAVAVAQETLVASQTQTAAAPQSGGGSKGARATQTAAAQATQAAAAQAQPVAAMNTPVPPPPTVTAKPAATNTPVPQPPTATVKPAATNTPVPQPPTATARPAATNTPLPAIPSPTATSAPPATATPKPAPTNTPAVAATPLPNAVVSGDSLNMREGPGDSFAVVKNYPKGTALTVLGQLAGAEWLKVKAADGNTGWMYRALLQVNVDLATVAVVPAPPTPTWSAQLPTGRIAYTVYKSAYNYDVYVVNADGSGKYLLVADASEPAFSKDGRSVVFYNWKGNGVDVMNADGSNRRRAINDGEAAFTNFSSDGSRLVYHTGEVNWVEWTFRLYIKVCNIDGKNERTLSPGEQPSWNPAGEQIAFKSCDGGNCGLYIMNSDASGRRKITQYADDQNPAFSPDGRKIAFSSVRDGNWEIYVMDADGSNQRRLTNSPTTDALPAWLSDGRHIAFRSDRGGVWSIYVMRDDGTNVYKVTDAPCHPQRWRWEKMGTTR